MPRTHLAASAACTTLLGFYGRFVLHARRAGLAFGAGIAALYGVLYVLLQLEQTALLLGSMLRFAVIAGLMVATRPIDWYALYARMRSDAARPRPGGRLAGAGIESPDSPATTESSRQRSSARALKPATSPHSTAKRSSC
jgi:hypothetical protein